MMTWKQKLASRELLYAVAGFVGLAYLLALVYAPRETLAITGGTGLLLFCLGVTVANYLRWTGDPEFQAAVNPPTTSDDWTAVEDQLRLAVYAALRAGLPVSAIARIVATEIAAYRE